MSLRYEVNHLLHITEIAHAKAGLAPQREYRDEGSGEFYRIDVETGLGEAVDNDVAIMDIYEVDDAVVVGLPDGRIVIVFVADEELEL